MKSRKTVTDSTLQEVSPPVIVSRRGVFVGLVAVLLLGVIAYGNSFNGQFVFDDRVVVADNPQIQKFWPIWHLLVPSEYDTSGMIGRPAVVVTFAINYAIGGKSTFGYHIVNLAIHLLAAMAMFGVVRRTLSLEVMPKSLSAASTWLATVSAAIWVVHPMNTTSVTYIYQRAEAMMGLFYLSTIYFSIRAMQSSTRFGRWHAAAIVCCAVGMACKETMVSCPLLVLLYDWMFVGKVFGEIVRRRWRLYAGLAAGWMVLAANLMAGGLRGGSETFARGMSSMEYAATQAGVVLHYLRLAFWPTDLCFDYKWPMATTVWQVLPGSLVAAVIVVFTIVGLINRSILGFLGAIFIAVLGVTSSFLPISEVACEYRMYLPLAAIVAAGVIVAYMFLNRFIESSPAGVSSRGVSRRFVAAAGLAIGCVIVVLLTFFTLARNSLYANPLSLWMDTVQKQPANYRAWTNVAGGLIAIGSLPEAGEAAEKTVTLSAANGIDEKSALQLHPYQRRCVAEAYGDRGGLMLQLGRVDRAIADCTRSIAIMPLSLAYANRGDAFNKCGEYKRAIEDYLQAVAMSPNNPAVYDNMGLAYQGLRDYVNACKNHSIAIEQRPDNPEFYFNRSVCQFFLRDYDGAWDDLLACRRLGGRIDPQFVADLSMASGRRL